MYSSNVLLLTAIIMLPIIIIGLYVIFRTVKKNAERGQMERMISDALDYGRYDEERPVQKSIDTKLIEFWRDLLKPAGVVKLTSNDQQNVVKIIMICLFLFVLTYLFTFNLALGILPIFIFIAGLIVYCKIKISQLEKLLNDQLPGFLSSLKSNIQSNETPERALIGAINNTAQPLFGELEVVKSLIETGTFETALGALRRKTKNEYLIFLCSCIEISSEVGANLEDQIEIIEKMIAARQDLARKTDSAVAENMPILYAVAVAVPFLFGFMYYMDESVRNFWFKSLTSWILFFAIFVICGVGTWMGNKIIQGVRKM